MWYNTVVEILTTVHQAIYIVHVIIWYWINSKNTIARQKKTTASLKQSHTIFSCKAHKRRPKMLAKITDTVQRQKHILDFHVNWLGSTNNIDSKEYIILIGQGWATSRQFSNQYLRTIIIRLQDSVLNARRIHSDFTVHFRAQWDCVSGSTVISCLLHNGVQNTLLILSCPKILKYCIVWYAIIHIKL